jgi:hypothetical protein
MAWVPGMEDVHAVEHQGQVWLLARQEFIMDDGPARSALRVSFELYNLIDQDGWVPVDWDDVPELRDKIVLPSEDCSCFVLPPADFPGLSKNSIYFLSWESADEVNLLQENGCVNGDSYSYYMCKWDMVDYVSSIVKIPGVWDRMKPGMWFMPSLAN